jgi:hypothetical protein
MCNKQNKIFNFLFLLFLVGWELPTWILHCMLEVSMDVEGLGQANSMKFFHIFLSPKANCEVVVSFYLELFAPYASQYHLQIFCPKAAFRTLLKFIIMLPSK